jgi:hypothetical protein
MSVIYASKGEYERVISGAIFVVPRLPIAWAEIVASMAAVSSVAHLRTERV